MYRMLIVSMLLLLVACQQPEDPAPVEPDAEPVATPEPEPALAEQPGQDRLGEILDAQPEQIQARYDQRNPRETLEFFGIAPGMTVVEALPGGGWYSRILVPYLGAEGHLIGANYALEM